MRRPTKAIPGNSTVRRVAYRADEELWSRRLTDVKYSRHEGRGDEVTDAQYPMVLDLPAAARLLGIGRTLAYELVRTG
jgi:hypothetical protein